LNKKKLSIGLITLSLITTFSLTTLTKAEDFAGKEEKYIKLCSSSKLTNKQQKTCKEFNTYLNDKNKQLNKESKETKKEVKETKKTIENIEKELLEYSKRISEAQKELTYVNKSIQSLNQKVNKKKKLLEDRLYSMQTSLNSNMLISYLYSSHDISDFFRRITYVNEITSYEKEIIEDLKNSLLEVEKQKNTLSLLNDSLKKEQAQQKTLQEKYFALLEKQNREIASNSSEISKNQESIEDIQKNLAAIKKASDESKVNNINQATPNKKPSKPKPSNNEPKPDQNDKPSNDQDQPSEENELSSDEKLGLKIANKALTRQGYMYVWGGSHSMSAIKNPNQTQFDCSGLVNWAHYQCGVNIGVQYTKSLLSCGKKISRDDLQAGDIILFSSNGASSGVHHVGIYIGDNKMVHAPSTGKAIQVADLSYSYWQREWYTCRRLY